MFRGSRPQTHPSRWARLIGLLRTALLVACVTQLGGIFPLGLRAISAVTVALADDGACCDHEPNSEAPADCGADCGSDCSKCACPNGIRSLAATAHGFTVETLAAEQSEALGATLRAPRGPDPNSLFRPPRTPRSPER
jgi:hypothetical protein